MSGQPKKFLAEHGQLLAHAIVGVIWLAAAALEIAHKHDAFGIVAAIVIGIIGIWWAVWLWRTASAYRVDNRIARLAAEVLWKDKMVHLHVLLGRAAAEDWHARHIAGDMEKLLRGARESLTQIMNQKARGSARRYIIKLIAAIEPLLTLVQKLTQQEGIHFDEYLRDYIKANYSDSLKEFDRIRRVRSDEKAVKALSEQLNPKYLELHQAVDRLILEKQLSEPERRTLLKRVHRAIDVCQSEEASRLQTYDSGMGIQDHYNPGTFGYHLDDDDKFNFLRGIDIDEKTMFIKVIAPLVSRLY
jgi:uncharacterized membrane protein YeaQ/YmgE (transglycosylase-associated protein family)